MTGRPTERAERGARIFMLAFAAAVLTLCAYGVAEMIVGSSDFTHQCVTGGGHTVPSGRSGQLCVDQEGRVVGSWR